MDALLELDERSVRRRASLSHSGDSGGSGGGSGSMPATSKRPTLSTKTLRVKYSEEDIPAYPESKKRGNIMSRMFRRRPKSGRHRVTMSEGSAGSTDAIQRHESAPARVGNHHNDLSWSTNYSVYGTGRESLDSKPSSSASWASVNFKRLTSSFGGASSLFGGNRKSKQSKGVGSGGGHEAGDAEDGSVDHQNPMMMLHHRQASSVASLSSVASAVSASSSGGGVRVGGVGGAGAVASPRRRPLSLRFNRRTSSSFQRTMNPRRVTLDSEVGSPRNSPRPTTRRSLAQGKRSSLAHHRPSTADTFGDTQMAADINSADRRRSSLASTSSEGPPSEVPPPPTSEPSPGLRSANSAVALTNMMRETYSNSAFDDELLGDFFFDDDDE